MSNFQQCPASRLDYVVNWTNWLEDGDEIMASSWSSDPMLTFEDESFTDFQAVAFITGGDAGVIYTITNTITTDAGREHCQSFTLSVD